MIVIETNRSIIAFWGFFGEPSTLIHVVKQSEHLTRIILERGILKWRLGMCRAGSVTAVCLCVKERQTERHPRHCSENGKGHLRSHC